ncbi:hypothetical protein SASPL_148185 [Salvia splendens]|uniref:Uncharacterized protein n=1 Tax=Salvia splendens TaxID=180675 RepID=A0A8X8WAB5_SALSN|nr:hypothetical protein SASPL_148185 [Salvia splendens]
MGSNNNESASSSNYAPPKGTKASVIPKQREHVSTMMGKTIALAFGKSIAKVAGGDNNKAKVDYSWYGQLLFVMSMLEM